MQIRVGDVYSTVLNAKYNLDAMAVVRDTCRARPAGYMFMPRYRKGVWDGYISLMHGWAQFPTGLLDVVVKNLQHAKYDVELVDSSKYPESKDITPNMLKGIILRDYQIEAASEMIFSKRGVAKMATNSGKTEVMAAVIKALHSNSVVLVHRKELMYQTAERFVERGIDNVGMIGDGVFKPSKVTVAMVQTLGNRTDLPYIFKDNVVLFADECHHLQSIQTTNVFCDIPGCHRYGVSGTPLKYDILSDLKLIAATGPVIYELTNNFLIKEGYSAKPCVTIYTIESNDDDAWKLKYPDAYSEYVVNHEVRNKIIAQYAKSVDGVVLILVNIINHGKLLEKMTGGVFVSGGNSTEDRRAILDAMRTNKGIFIASPIFDEGVDVPGVNAVILAGGGKSQIKLLQRIGRGLRRKVGSNKLEILDFIDDTNKYLLEHSNARIDTYVQEGFDTIIK